MRGKNITLDFLEGVMDNKITPIELEQQATIQDKPVQAEPAKKQDKEWSNPIEFLMTCISMFVVASFSIYQN